ncbi:MAG: phage terminase large subunit [Clostridia bacterium]|nr:phage terminase large subunit [Clostridia bacterium]MBR1654784.1 phage terminase large subunit [Clostridia bacterium]
MNNLKEELKKQARLELARRDFFEYCKLTASDFYKEDRTFLKSMCNELQNFYESDERVVVINLPPRHGKSRTAGKLVEWIFGQNNKEKIMTGSYNEILSGTFAKSVRDEIASEKTEGITVYTDIFPNTKIKYGESSANKWALEGSSQANYLATSPKGTATGFGCTIMIIDDLIKNVEEAYNENILQKQIDWFNNTMLSRTETGFKLIIIMTRWAENDLAGYILANYDNVRHINYKAVQEDGSMLCEDILNKEDYNFKTKNMNKDIVYANYQQEPIDVKNRLYSGFKTYEKLPPAHYIMNYTDTADEGSDYLCSIDYAMYNNEYYILDIIYTQESMETTEPAVANMLTKDHVGYANVESNNGGRGFARNVQRELKELKNTHTKVNWFHQSENKQARILSNSTAVMNNIYFPVNWKDKFPDFAKHILHYVRTGKNEHDDAEDCLTGVYENPKPNTISFGYNKII